MKVAHNRICCLVYSMHCSTAFGFGCCFFYFAWFKRCVPVPLGINKEKKKIRAWHKSAEVWQEQYYLERRSQILNPKGILGQLWFYQLKWSFLCFMRYLKQYNSHIMHICQRVVGGNWNILKLTLNFTSNDLILLWQSHIIQRDCIKLPSKIRCGLSF